MLFLVRKDSSSFHTRNTWSTISVNLTWKPISTSYPHFPLIVFPAECFHCNFFLIKCLLARSDTYHIFLTWRIENVASLTFFFSTRYSFPSAGRTVVRLFGIDSKDLFPLVFPGKQLTSVVWPITHNELQSSPEGMSRFSPLPWSTVGKFSIVETPPS